MADVAEYGIWFENKISKVRPDIFETVYLNNEAFPNTSLEQVFLSLGNS